MPTLTPVSETTETLSVLSEGSETLDALAEGSETITALAELSGSPTTHLGFFPALVLTEAPYAFPSSTSYPGATVTTGSAGLSLATVAEATETLTVLVET